ncbi:MAG: DUF2865 domain-containing protein [Hyphomicrobiales bacterium]|nr:DUF2865 domain-containing protein [Hyphomicrobiales bacterium]
MPATSRRNALAAIAALSATIAVFAGADARAQGAADQWASAIREQQEQIVSNRAAQARCGAANDPRCAALADRGRLMDQNLGRLQRQHARLTGTRPPPPASASRATINGQPIGATRAGQPRWETPPGVGEPPAEPARPTGLFSFLFGGGGTSETHRSSVRIDGRPIETTFRIGPNGEEIPVDDGVSSGAWGPGSGNYRTLCVRTCDGYFFPVSFNASYGRLRTDANVCKALCPETETRLFYHDASGQEAENAIAADDGSPLASMPNAFLYRSKRVEGCTCGTPDPRLIPVEAGGLKGLRSAMASDPAGVPLPTRRPSPDQDPATQAVELSGISTEPVAPLTPMSAEAAEKIAAAASPRRVRIVGPKWLSDRLAAEAASSPDRDRAR